MAGRLASDSDMWDERMVERLDDVVKGIFEFVHGRTTNLEAKLQRQWEAFEQKWEDKIVQLKPGSKEGSVSLAEYRIRTSVHADMEKLWTERVNTIPPNTAIHEQMTTTNGYVKVCTTTSTPSTTVRPLWTIT